MLFLTIVGLILFFIVCMGLWFFVSYKNIEFLKIHFKEYKGEFLLRILFIIMLTPISLLTLPAWIFYLLKIVIIDICFDYTKQKFNELGKGLWDK